ncbi:MAG: bi-domain-containing oxidoreductase [Kiritimatiellae bacterium]|nr:bi-domain-containing oxidoreductase [Kiritimatiellia bacterium]MDW8459482.1 bi-domain-containing oxidoreductase [Verrucomicrobiota bacterium]
MRQVLLNKRTGAVEVVDVPDPVRRPGHLAVAVRASVISAGTESALRSSSGRSLLGRIAERPELIKKGLELLRDRGLHALQTHIESKTSGYEVLGYSCAGVVEEGDPAAPDLPPGTRIACGGVGYAMHAERVVVPRLLCVRVPEGVDDEAAAYTVIGAIALQGIRQAGAAVGENVAVIGLGLIGLFAVQLLRAAGCRVLGIDPSPRARERARDQGCLAVADLPDAIAAAAELTNGVGVDAALICASAPDSSPVALAGELARSRGRVVMVGATGMEIPRELYFRKELSFLMSRSYGPGRYDASYEEQGIDYPIDYVRFTEQRNMQAVLELAAAGAIHPGRLTTHRFPLQDAPAAYALLQDRDADRVGIVLTYASRPARPAARIERTSAPRANEGTLNVSFAGAGGYATGVLLPLLQRQNGISLRGVAALRPDHAVAAANRFGFGFSTGDAREIIGDPATHVVFIATRHDTHAELAAAALQAGKHVWCEKPLALDAAGCEQVENALRSSGGVFAVGFNRRFSPLARMLREARDREGGPVFISIRVNAGRLPPSHWTQDPQIGGGRLLGEGCHFFDLLCFLADARPVRVFTEAIRSPRIDLPAHSNFASTVSFRDGSIGVVVYSADGSPRLSKERVEMYIGGRAAVLDDFNTLTIHEPNRDRVERLSAQDKGQRAMLDAFFAAIRGKQTFPQSPESILISSRLTLAAQDSLNAGKPVDIAD